MKVKIEIDGEVKFCHDNFEKLDYGIMTRDHQNGDEDEEQVVEEPVIGDNELERFDLEEYTVPGIIRKILKTTKLREVVQIRTTRKDKLSTHFDEEGKCFKKDILLSFEKECVITFALIAFQQKDFIFKLLITDKIQRFLFTKNIATKFYKVIAYSIVISVFDYRLATRRKR